MSYRYGRILNWLEAHKPVAPVRAHVFLVALMWTVVGLFLFVRGAVNMMSLPGSVSPWWLVVAAFIGVLKGRLIFDKTAKRVVSRTLGREGDRCLGGFLSLKSWGMILFMVFLGMSLRVSPLPGVLVWGVYVAVGAGLFFSSRLFWMEWIRQGHSY
ncbi:MAG: hypothetical protein JRJ43_05880 [Deltaproteobacteria bacterium]|nr:hypothetical protein [Deltaproteobacteria bacterium]MBW1719078.1 hypothetical protein [Deltaproteobacteria bacterium]MBW1937971.1 hypothetical protein [Deltaproteobacteria bacterium]MBW2079673.1 hypothetical protein [Deltaproteobacteria bacterium]MBW2351507.1 hypothetical protein [Deltaproteobacteria bacterium]